MSSATAPVVRTSPVDAGSPKRGPAPVFEEMSVTKHTGAVREKLPRRARLEDSYIAERA